MFTVSPNQAQDEILACISAGLTPLITSSPGMGKSSMVSQVAKTFRLKLLDFRLSQCTPEDLQGFPMRNGDKATFTPFDIFPLDGEPVPEGYDGWLLFLDELTSATKPVQAAAYKLILDRMVGSFHLHTNVAMVAAGNKATDRAVVNQMSTALQSRLIHYELDIDHKEWVELAYELEIDHRIIGFINYMPSKLMDFRPDHQDKTFPCPRTWEFLSKLIKDQEVSEKMGARVAGTIGQGVAVEFITFAKIYHQLPKIADITADPKNAMVPSEISAKYATMSMLVEHADKATLDAVIDYIKRFDVELQIVFSRGLVAKEPVLRREHTKFANYLQDMVRYLY